MRKILYAMSGFWFIDGSRSFIMAFSVQPEHYAPGNFRLVFLMYLAYTILCGIFMVASVKIAAHLRLQDDNVDVKR